MQLDYQKAQQILINSTILYNESELSHKIDLIATKISQEIQAEIPVFLSVMNGGMFFSAELLKRIKHPLEVDYIHASRYGNEQFGSKHITWFRQPTQESIKGKIVYICDDILDEGYTLAEIKRFLLDIGAKECYLVVLIDKTIDKIKPVYADHVCLTAPNKFLFGFGMDIFGLYRQLPEVYIYTQTI